MDSHSKQNWDPLSDPLSDPHIRDQHSLRHLHLPSSMSDEFSRWCAFIAVRFPLKNVRSLAALSFRCEINKRTDAFKVNNSK